ncbi:MAG: NifU N-terminal domain-containing protein [Phycisphaerales bacterium]|jgi:hypothetical protein|nr:NifU N-terminal domain-containing protein [Phycisphaerales bacterium]
MGLRVVQYLDTPNPQALKCVLDGVVSVGSRPYRAGQAGAGGGKSSGEADGRSDALASALLAIPGVVGLLLHGDWMTVSKSPDARWAAIKPRVEATLKAWADEGAARSGA